MLGVLFAQGELTVEQAMETAFFEELEQQKKWGEDEEIRARHQSILNKLKQLEDFRRERSLSED